MYPNIDIKDIIRKVYYASNIMTRSCYLSTTTEVRNIDAGQI